MKISLNWIKDYVSYGLSTGKLSHKLTMAGLETEEVSKVDGDTVMEFEITPNRADCLSMIGMSREIATITQKKLNIPVVKKISYPKTKYDIKIEDTKDCKRYLGTVIENITVKPAPAAMKTKISSVGNRPISNLVDITNFVMLEQGQPLHVFDLDKLEGGKIIVRRAKKGERMVAIDGEEYKLDPSILVIADAQKPVAIAGIMGGKDTEVGPDTKNILLESAYFNPILTRRAGRKLGLASDSSYRFERGVDFEGVQRGSQRAAQLILENAGGKITQHGQAGLNKNPFVRKPVAISMERINQYLGTKITATKVKTTLTSLGFKVAAQGKSSFKVTPPSFRSDIHRDVDLIEEVGRIIGYDELPTSMPTVPTCDIPVHAGKALRDQARELLLGQGLNEAVTFSLISEEDLIKSGLGDLKTLKITNPLSLDQEIMQPSMLPSLLSVARGNINRGQKNVRLFELGRVYPASAKEEETLAICLSGNKTSDWRTNSIPVGIFDIKGALEQLFTRLNVGEISVVKKDHVSLDAAQSMKILCGSKEIGYLGKIKKEILKNWEIKDADVFYAQIQMPVPKDQKRKKFTAISEYPAIVQDVSLAVKEEISFQQIEEIARTHGKPLLKDVVFNELYLGEKISAGQRGVVFSLVYQSDQGTLREDEVLKVHEKIVAAILDQLDAIRR